MATPNTNTNTNTKRKRLIEKSLPPKIESYIPESRLFMQLQALERKLDTKVVRKRLEVQEALGKPVYKKRILRVFVSNLAANQGAVGANDDSDLGDAERTEATAPSWTLRVEGRLVDPPGTTWKTRPATHKFSEFLNSMTVEMDRNTELFGENIVQWRRAAAEADVDGFEIKRRGDEDVFVRIFLDIRTATDRFQVHHPLMRELLDIRGPVTKAEFIMKLWQYIKLNSLQDAEDPDQIRCDAGLLQVFNTPVVSFTAIPQMLQSFLRRPDPLVIEYTVRVHKGDFHMAQYAFDVEVEVEDFSRQGAGPLAAVQSRSRELAQVEAQLAQQMQEIHNARAKREFLRGFADDPVAFIHRWIDNQTKDLEVILGDRRHGLEAALAAIMAADERGQASEADAAKWLKESALYDEPWADEAVFHYLSAKTQERMQQLLQQQQQQLHQQQQHPQQIQPQSQAHQQMHHAAAQMQNGV